MGIFIKIYNFFVIEKEIFTIYNPFFDRFNKDLNAFVEINEEIPDNITKIYLKLSASQKQNHIQLCKKYTSYKKLAKDHNIDINFVRSVAKDFNYKDIINEPRKYNEKREAYKKAFKILENLKINDSKIRQFYDNIDDLEQNIDIIIHQYEFIDLYNKVFDFSHYDFIDNRIRLNIEKSLSSIIEFLEKCSKKYYDFSKVTKLGALIEEHNKAFVAEEIQKPLFSDINGKSLDYEQRVAAARNEDASLVIAGAGSGKTLTICGKVKYLLSELNVDPKDILLLSYSKKSAEDLESKTQQINSELNVATFHKVGLEILQKAENIKYNIEEQYDAIVETYFREELRQRPEILDKVINFFAMFMGGGELKKYKDDGEMFEDLKKADFRTFKDMLRNMSNNPDKKETIKKELVKSYEELALANFYFINGIDYEYERPYEIKVDSTDRRQYRPDFYLTKYKIYHEHYGVDKNGQANQYEGREAQEYVATMRWKKNLHELNQTTCLETYSYQFADGTVFEKLEQQLRANGVEFRKLTSEEIQNALDSIYEGNHFKSFINLMKSFISLYKARYGNRDDFETLKGYTFATKYQKLRAGLFLDIAKDVYDYYINHIRTENKIDFDDMILKSIVKVDKIGGFKYKYIIVDEFQDISYSRMLFLKKLIERGNSKLFAVGDDWQAIYRFSGCDLNIFLNFEQYFGYSDILYLTSTHRNSQELQNVVSDFIRANPEQYYKEIHSEKHLNFPIKVVYFRENRYLALKQVLQSIVSKTNNAKILLLGRNNRDIQDYLGLNLYMDKHVENPSGARVYSKEFPNLEMTFSTVHSSKGLEEDFVVLLNADDSRLGFPNRVEDDSLLNLVLSNPSKFPYAEERRLWYVALTRTRGSVYIIADFDKPSPFLLEIRDKCIELNHDNFKEEDKSVLCPRCKSGHLVIRVNEKDGQKFLGCSNYPHCDYTINDFNLVKQNKRCPRCGDFMEFKRGKYGAYYHCHNRHCNHNVQYKNYVKPSDDCPF